MAMQIFEFLDRTLTALGYELVDVESGGSGRSIRVFIDKPGGVTVDDCAEVSRHLGRCLAVENVDYARLEVSSPGLDRPLRKEADFERFAGAKAKVKLRIPVEGRRQYQGILRGLKDRMVVLEVGENAVCLELGNVQTARLIPNVLGRIE